MKNFKKIVVFVLFVAMTLTVLCSCSSSNQKVPSYDNATRDLAAFAADVKPVEQSVKLDPNEKFDLELSHGKQALPDISEYPFVVNPTTSSYITVYSTNTMVIQAANEFNADAITVEGEKVSVGVRAVPSALGTDFILAEKYMPEVLIPASEIYGNILSYRSIQTELIMDATIGNVSGIVISDATSEKTGVSNFADLVHKVHDGGDSGLSIGYVDPLQDPDGLNFILSALYEFDSAQPIGENAVESLKQLQHNIKYIAVETAQLKSSFLRGVLDGYVLDRDTYNGASEYKSGYKFIPFGVPQSNPVYTIGKLTPTKAQTAEKFAEYCKNIGAGVSDPVITGYSSGIELTSVTAGELSRIYRSTRGGSSSTTAVFVADVSGSMQGAPMRKLKTGLRGAINSIDPNNNVGLVTFDSRVYIDVPIAPFDAEQQSYFSNAISNMTDGSNTAMYNAIAVSLQMLLDYQAKNPDTKLVLFVLTDGDSNVGINLDKIRPIVAALQIPIYTIGYESETNGLNTDMLEQLAMINEARFVDAEGDNINYVLASLLGSQA